jgi:undecaprenyl diphosphate synthase
MTRETPHSPVARHVAIITDGNRRWARAHGVSIGEGHEAGADTLEARLLDAIELGVSELGIYSFSTENWSRSPEEVDELVLMVTSRLATVTPVLHGRGVRMCFIGRRTGLEPSLLEQLNRSEAMTADNLGMTLFVAFNYGGRAEILDAARRFAGGAEEEFRACLYAPAMHDPDLIIRTGGEKRLSNYLLWQAAYAELIFREELWPDFTREALERSLAEFSERRRRFGGR